MQRLMCSAVLIVCYCCLVRGRASAAGPKDGATKEGVFRSGLPRMDAGPRWPSSDCGTIACTVTEPDGSLGEVSLARLSQADRDWLARTIQ